MVKHIELGKLIDVFVNNFKYAWVPQKDNVLNQTIVFYYFCKWADWIDLRIFSFASEMLLGHNIKVVSEQLLT